MIEIPIARVYDEIVEYYQNLDIRSEIFERVGLEIAIETGDGTRHLTGYTTEEDALLNHTKAYRIYDSEDQKESDLIKLRRYLSSSFSYLMKNVFYLDLSRIRKKRTYYIPEKDYPVIKEILLRSVSQHEFDRIIGEWLNGKIRDDDYHAISDLSERLFSLIRNIDGIDAQTANQWITALQIALRSYMAYAMVEAENNLRSLFSSSLPFVLKGNGFQSEHIHHEQIAQELDTELNHLCKNAEDNILQALYQYLNTVDFEKIKSSTAFPPVELLKLKSVCEYLYGRDLVKKDLPNANIVDTATQYFITVDRTYEEKLKARKKKDHERHQRNKQQK